MKDGDTLTTPNFSTFSVIHWQRNFFLSGCLLFLCIFLLYEPEIIISTTNVDVNTKIHTKGVSYSHNGPSFHMLLRCYSGDVQRFHEMFAPSLEAFFPFSRINITVILDDENPADHAFGETIIARLGYLGVKVIYASPPPSSVLSSSPYKIESPTRISGPGYLRQLYDTFMMDNFVPFASDTDIIGILDADAPLISLLTPSVLWNTNQKLLFHPVAKVDIWRGDNIMLGGKPGETCPYDSMRVNSMPQLYYRRTFAACSKCHQYQ